MDRCTCGGERAAVNRGDIYMVSLDPTQRHEQRGDQPRALEIAVTSGRKVETAPQHIVDDVLAKLVPIFE